MEAQTCFPSLHILKLDLGYENTMRVFGAVFLGHKKCVIHDWDGGPVSMIILFSPTEQFEVFRQKCRCKDHSRPEPGLSLVFLVIGSALSPILWSQSFWLVCTRAPKNSCILYSC